MGDQKSNIWEGQKGHQKIEQEVVKNVHFLTTFTYTIENVNAGG